MVLGVLIIWLVWFCSKWSVTHNSGMGLPSLCWPWKVPSRTRTLREGSSELGGRKFTNFTSRNSPPKKIIKFLKPYPESKYLVHPTSNTDSSLTLHFLFSLPHTLSLPQHKCHRPGSLWAGLSPCIVKHCSNHTPHQREHTCCHHTETRWLCHRNFFSCCCKQLRSKKRGQRAPEGAEVGQKPQGRWAPILGLRCVLSGDTDGGFC